MKTKDTWRMSSVFWRSEIIDVLSDQERSVERSNIHLSHCRIMSSSKPGSLGIVTYHILMDLKQLKSVIEFAARGHVDLSSLPEPGGSRRMFRNSELSGRVLCPLPPPPAQEWQVTTSSQGSRPYVELLDLQMRLWKKISNGFKSFQFSSPSFIGQISEFFRVLNSKFN